MTERPKRFVIDRSKWRRGGDDFDRAAKGEGDTMLLNAEGYQCCLGFVAEQCGVERSKLLNKCIPSEIGTYYGRGIDGVLVEPDRIRQCALTHMALGINDSDEIEDSDREQQLTALFAQHGYELAFEGGES